MPDEKYMKKYLVIFVQADGVMRVPSKHGYPDFFTTETLSIIRNAYKRWQEERDIMGYAKGLFGSVKTLYKQMGISLEDFIPVTRYLIYDNMNLLEEIIVLPDMSQEDFMKEVRKGL